MMYKDLSAESEFVLNCNKFWIDIDVSFLLDKLKDLKIKDYKKILEQIKGNLFKFYHNLKWEKDIFNAESEEKAILIQKEENSNYLNFKLSYSKEVKLNKHVQLALFISMMPQFLNGSEFCNPDKETGSSPRGKLCSIISINYERYNTFVDVEGTWTLFSDHYIVQLNYFENVIEYMLKEWHHPVMLIYEVCPCPIQRPNKQVEVMLEEYLKIVTSKEFNKNEKYASQSDEIRLTEELKSESDENNQFVPKSQSPDMYKNKGVKGSIISKNKSKKKKAHGGLIGWWFTS